MTTTDNALVKSFKAARRVSVPIVAIETADPAATLRTLRVALNGKTPILEWDVARGIRTANDLGRDAAQLLNIEPAAQFNLAEVLIACERLPEHSVMFIHNAMRFLPDVPVLQAVWNLRDAFKRNTRMLVLLSPTFTLPTELAGDVIRLDEPSPTRDELGVTLDKQYKNANLTAPDAEAPIRAAALDAVVGLPSTFTAEQNIAMALTPDGVDVDMLWQHKRKAIAAEEGLSVADVTDSGLQYLKGIDSAAAYMQELIDADAFGAIVFIDEGEKAFAGGMSDYSGDSGVAKDQVGQVLAYIENTKSIGVLLAGIAGCGKTELAKATAASSGKPLIVFDLGAMKGGVVGESERKIRAALKVVTATAEGRVLFIMTANKTTQFTPELNRRFPDQFFFDTPDDAAREAIWPVYVAKYKLTPSQAARPAGFAAGWTGAEIARACRRAALLGKTVVEAGRFIVPQSVSAAAIIAGMRREAAGRFLSATAPGYYTPPAPRETVGDRAIEVV